MPRLFVLSGDDLGAVHEVADGARIGRARDVDVTVHGASVSRHHARFELRGETWFVVDLGSSNGVRVGGERIAEAALADGEEFLLGDVEVRFRIATGATRTPGAAAPPPRAAAPPPAPVERAKPAEPLAGEPDGGIELEGDWSEPPAPAAPLAPEPPAAASSAAASSAAATPSRGQRSRVPGSQPAPQPDQETRLVSEGSLAHRAAQAARRRTAAAGTIPGVRRTTSGGRVLQYQRVEDTGGLMTAELSQQPTIVRWLLYVLVVAIFGGLAWGAFQLSAGARRAAAPETVDG